MKKLFSVLVLTLAANFAVLIGAGAWMVQSGRLDRDKALAVKNILFPPPDNAPGAEATTQPADAPTTRPLAALEALLAEHAGRPPGEQVQFIRQAFDAKMAELDRRQRELGDLARQIDLAKDQVERDRASLNKSAEALRQQQEQAEKLAGDKGFQDSLALYTSMPAKQAKTVFMTLDDQTVMNYLQAMQPRQASKIIREFKTPDELSRIQRVLEQMRQADEAQPPAPGPPGKTAPGPAVPQTAAAN